MIAPADLGELPALPDKKGTTDEALRLEERELRVYLKDMHRVLLQTRMALRHDAQGLIAWETPAKRFDWRHSMDCRIKTINASITLAQGQMGAIKKMLRAKQTCPAETPNQMSRRHLKNTWGLLEQLEKWFEGSNHPDAKGWVKSIRTVRSGEPAPNMPSVKALDLTEKILALRGYGKAMREIAEELDAPIFVVMRILMAAEQEKP